MGFSVIFWWLHFIILGYFEFFEWLKKRGSSARKHARTCILHCAALHYTMQLIWITFGNFFTSAFLKNEQRQYICS